MQKEDIYHLLDRARLAEASDDTSFWEKSYEVKKQKNLLIYHLIFFRLYQSSRSMNLSCWIRGKDR